METFMTSMLFIVLGAFNPAMKQIDHPSFKSKDSRDTFVHAFNTLFMQNYTSINNIDSWCVDNETMTTLCLWKVKAFP